MSILTGNELIIRCREIEDVSEKAISEDLLRTLQETAKQTQCYAFKHRHKGLKSIEKKVRRKRQEGQKALLKFDIQSSAIGNNDKESAKIREEERHKIEKLTTYEPNHLTDAWGCRFVTLYQNEIPQVVRTLLAKLEDFNKKEVHGVIRMHEFVIYTNRPDHDPLSIVKPTSAIVSRSNLFTSVISEDSIIRQPENRKSAYSSVHFVFEREIEIEHAGKDRCDETAYFEIQIRDIFEEGWGEVQHNLLYSGKDNIDTDETGEDTDSDIWKIHLNALKTFVDGCSQHASIIKLNREASKPAKLPSITSRSATIYSVDQQNIVRSLRKVGAKKETQKAISKAYTLLIAAESVVSAEEAIRHYRDASTIFTNLSNVLNGSVPVETESDTRDIKYYIDMESGYCKFMLAERQGELFQHSRQDQVQIALYHEAANTFKSVEKIYPNDPIVKFRLAKALLMSSDSDLADIKYTLELCILNISSDAVTGNNHWIAIAARTQLGFVLWTLSQHQEKDQEKNYELLERAAQVSIDSFEIWLGQSAEDQLLNCLDAHKAASNILYFVSEIIRKGVDLVADWKVLLKKYIEKVEDMGIVGYREYYKTRDNLMHAYLAMGDVSHVEKAISLGKETFSEMRVMAEERAKQPLNLDDIQKYLTKPERECFRSAFEALNGGCKSASEP